MPENFECSAVQLYRKIGQEPFVLEVGIVGVEFVCVCGGRVGGGGREGRGYKLYEDQNSVWLCKTEDFLQLRKKKNKMSKMSKKKQNKKTKKNKKNTSRREKADNLLWPLEQQLLL